MADARLRHAEDELANARAAAGAPAPTVPPSMPARRSHRVMVEVHSEVDADERIWHGELVVLAGSRDAAMVEALAHLDDPSFLRWVLRQARR